MLTLKAQSRELQELRKGLANEVLGFFSAPLAVACGLGGCGWPGLHAGFAFRNTRAGIQ